MLKSKIFKSKFSSMKVKVSEHNGWIMLVDGQEEFEIGLVSGERVKLIRQAIEYSEKRG